MKKRWIGILLAAIGLGGCGQTAQQRFALPVSVSGSVTAPFDVGLWSVELDSAEVALGPIYFCSTASASSDLCPSAVAEITSVVVIDGLDPTPFTWPGDPNADMGAEAALAAISGSTIRSAFFDYGISFLNTASRPAAIRPIQGTLAGHSAHFSGRATSGSKEVNFSVDVDVLPQVQGSRAVQGLRTEKALGSAEAKGQERDSLTIRIAPNLLFAQVDFDQLVGQPMPLALDASSQMASAIATALVGSSPPQLVWSQGQ